MRKTGLLLRACTAKKRKKKTVRENTATAKRKKQKAKTTYGLMEKAIQKPGQKVQVKRGAHQRN